MIDLLDEAKIALDVWRKRGPFEVARIPIGLINATFRVNSLDSSYVLQRLHPIFAPTVNEDIDAVTLWLAKKNIVVPRPVKTDDGQLWTMVNDHCWRMLTFVEGHSFDQVKSTEMAFGSGQLVGKFHRALADFDYQYRFVRAGVHNTSQFLDRLEKALLQHASHEWYDRVAPFAEKLLRDGRQLSDFSSLPKRHSHGDLKISNLLFDHHMQALCLLDLDTLGLMPWPVEMGDAFRSWCNPAGENTQEVAFDENIFSAALTGYCQLTKHLWSKDEIESLLSGMKAIPLELSTRFLLDVLEDQYWGWDATRFPSRAAHNFLRAQGQWALYSDILRKDKNLSHIIQRAFAS